MREQRPERRVQVIAALEAPRTADDLSVNWVDMRPLVLPTIDA
jgi:hypothetical protein